MLNFNDLQAFITVAEELNFRKASERLGISQPPLTRLIAKLEDQLGTKLFIRDTRNVELTGSGMALLSKARDILEQLADVEKSVRDVGALKRGSLNIHFSSLAFYSALPKLVWSYKEQFPKIDISLKERPTKNLLVDLKKGLADLVFVEGSPGLGDFQSRPIHSEVLGLLLPIRHPLAKKKSLQLSELKNEIFILHERKEMPAFHDGILSFLKKQVLNYKIRYRKQGEACPILVATDQGVLLATEITRRHQTPGTVFVPLKNPTPSISIHAVWNHDVESLELSSFLNYIQEQYTLPDPDIKCLMGFGHWKK